MSVSGDGGVFSSFTTSLSFLSLVSRSRRERRRVRERGMERRRDAPREEEQESQSTTKRKKNSSVFLYSSSLDYEKNKEGRIQLKASPGKCIETSYNYQVIPR